MLRSEPKGYLFIDDREPASLLNELAGLGLPATRMRLSAGDVLLTADVDRPYSGFAIERKAPGDFLASIQDGRLFLQAKALGEVAHWPIIAIIGDLEIRPTAVFAHGRQTGWHPHAVNMAIFRLQSAGCTVLLWPTTLADLIRNLLPRLGSNGEGLPPRVRDPLIFMDERVWFLSQLPGVGPKRAKQYLSQADSLLHALLIAYRERKEVRDFLGSIQPDQLHALFGFPPLSSSGEASPGRPPQAPDRSGGLPGSHPVGELRG